MSVDLEQIPQQKGTAVLSVADGSVVKCTGELATEDGARVCEQLYRILMDTAVCIGNEPLKKITVSYRSFQYALAVANDQVLIVKKETESH